MEHSVRAKTNMTKQLKAQFAFYKKDLEHEQTALKKAKSYLKYNLPGVKSMIYQHRRTQRTRAHVLRLQVRLWLKLAERPPMWQILAKALQSLMSAER